MHPLLSRRGPRLLALTGVEEVASRARMGDNAGQSCHSDPAQMLTRWAGW